ncbi:MAG: single-stranded DNA-binding protein [Paludibacteraceae bacterium]|nr:single-stranded DNA-binding protein [Paludibacteraceae bacterium]
MKNFQNSFKISGYIGYSEVRALTNKCVCRFALSVAKFDKTTNERTSAFLNAEAWAEKEQSLEAFKVLTKGSIVTIEGTFKPEEWTDKNGQKQNRVILVAKKFYPVEEIESTEEK